MPEAIKPIKIKEILRYGESPLRALSPENPQHRKLAGVADLASLEALNPEDMTHNPMTEKQLTRWMGGDKNHMTRFFVVDPKDFSTYVDEKAFKAAQRKAKREGDLKQAEYLEDMKKLGVVGYTYVCNDTNRDPDFRRRASLVRQSESLPSNRPVWEYNQWFVPGAKDEHVGDAVSETLRHLIDSRLSGQSVAVMFVEAADLRDALNQKLNKAITLEDLADPENRIKAEEALQDTRVLQQEGFQYHGLRIKYEETDEVPDFVYTLPLLAGMSDLEQYAWDHPRGPGRD